MTSSNDLCTPFQGTDKKIAADVGNTFDKGVKIRLNGRVGPQTVDTAIWADKFRVASVVMEGNAVPPTKGIDRIGRDRNNFEFAGFLTELLVWNKSLSDVEVQVVEEYLLQKYKISVFEVK